MPLFGFYMHISCLDCVSCDANFVCFLAFELPITCFVSLVSGVFSLVEKLQSKDSLVLALFYGVFPYSLVFFHGATFLGFFTKRPRKNRSTKEDQGTFSTFNFSGSAPIGRVWGEGAKLPGSSSVPFPRTSLAI